MGLGVEVMHYISEDRDYFVTRSALGEDLTHFLDSPKLLCEVLADALRTLHSQSVENIPVSSQFRSFLELTSREFDRVSYDNSMQIGSFRLESKEQAWEILQKNKEKLKPTTLIHGDACLPNILCHEGAFSTFIDLGHAGAGDRHMDLYWTIWSLEYNLKTDRYTEDFLDKYGRENIDFELLKVITAFESFS
jgi:kanamycin kinase